VRFLLALPSSKLVPQPGMGRLMWPLIVLTSAPEWHTIRQHVPFRGHHMSRAVILTPEEEDGLAKLGQRLKLARLRRNLTQVDVAERAGATRKSIVALEAGRASVGIGLLVKVLGVLGYPGRIAELLESDPVGEDVAMVHGRKQARRTPDDVADF